ncbi:MAG: FtsX-like permease family protein [Rubrimonas sp.]
MTVFRQTLLTLLAWWRRRPGQLAALMAGLALATALWSAVQALNMAARDSYAEAAGLLGGAAVATIARPEGGAFDEALFARLRRAGVQVSPVVEGRVRAEGRALRVVGVDLVTLPPGGALATLGEGADGDADALLGVPRRTLVAPATLAALGWAEGGTPMVEGRPVPPLVGRPGVAPETLVMDIGQAQRLLGLEGAVSRFLIRADRAPSETELHALTDGLLRVAGDNPDDDLDRLTESFHLNLTAFGLLSFVVGLFIAHAAAGLAFEQRLGLIRTLRGCGAPARTVAAALLIEIAGVALLAGLLGMAGGYAVAGALASDVAASLRGLYGAPAAGELSLSPLWWLSGLGMALLGALTAAGGGIWRAARMPVLAPARPAAWAADHARRMRAQAVVAVVLLAAAWGFAAFGDGLTAGFALLATMLLGAALAAPPLLSAALSVAARRARGPVAHWLLADARAGLGGLSLALMALMLALSANIGVGTMVTGFRATFTDWLENRLAAEVYVRTPDPATAAEFERAASAHPDVLAVLPTMSADARLSGWPVEVLGLADDPTYRDRWPLIAGRDPWDGVAAGEAALVSEQLARRLALEIGDAIALPAAAGPWTLRVAGVHPDYGNPRGQVVVGLGPMAQRMPEARVGSFGLRVADGREGVVMAALAADPALQGIEAIDQTQVRRLSLGLFDRTFAVTAALNVLTLGVAAAALFASLTTLADLRLPQLAPLWAMGLTRERLAALDLARTLALALGAAALAIPLGVALAWALVAVVNVQAFGWRLPLRLYPLQWLGLTAVALLAAALAAAPPAIRLRRTPPARLLGVFASER